MNQSDIATKTPVAITGMKDSGIAWLGDIPDNWETRRLKYVASCNDEVLAEDTEPELDLLYVDIGNVDSSFGITKKEEMRFGSAPSRARRRVRHGDVIASTVRTYLRAIAPILDPEPNLVVSTGFAVIRPRKHLEPGFAAYALRAPYFVDAVVARSVGVSYPAINASDLIDLPIALPPLDQQRSIAARLDRETARIDALLEKKRRQIELLRERRAAFISTVVTRGLNRNTPMRSSGIEWLGETPKHWRIARAKILLREIDERSTTGQEELLTVSHITGVTPRSEKEVTMFMAESLEDYKKCEPNDLVINTMWAWMGALGIAPSAGIVSPSYNVYRFRDEASEPLFYDYLFRTPRFAAAMRCQSKGIWTSRLRLYPEEFFEIRLPVPPREEQRAIVDAIRKETGSYTTLQGKIEESIERLREYRTTLISAAVTGKLNVRQEVPA